ncbi:beta strand repeat-containing protein [Siansivirga zeaxanthinifaciens]|uniref:PKD domain-containing protein n=1 Tax=Siansivirga zeaxanthinifaciens CC-SAMT-1 TaxID=1454006 RepID=A0A0C5WID7_9FLAO|nr:PKD domain-containing protein [Siansivirga zeaxanthinifaciens]AJR04929.1 hypothetical protein AW14_11220 [Siansivirga zeaxanthinifaciens CC-SAMT-1]
MKTITFKINNNLKKYIALILFIFVGFTQIQAQCTVPSNFTGAQFVTWLNTNQNTCNGVVIIPNGIDITLLANTTIPSHINRIEIKNGGQILWANNSVELTLAENTAIDIENITDIGKQTGALGSTSSSCNNTRTIYIGGVRYSACTGGGNVCLIFADLIEAGGTPKIDSDVAVIGGVGNNVCFDTAFLDATIGNIPDGITVSSYQWTQTGGPGTSQFSSPTSEDTNVTVSVPGLYEFTITVEIPLGSSGDCLAQIVEIDAIIQLDFLPAITSSYTYSVDANCGKTINFTDTSSDPYPGGAPVVYLWDFGDGTTSTLQNPSHTFSTFGDKTVTLKVSDADGAIADCNNDTSTQIITIADNINPNALCKNITIQLDSSGSATIVPADIDGGSTDACGTITLSASKTSFSCADVGANQVTLTVTDDSGNTDTCTATVTVQDNVPPTALCQNVTIQLDATGNASVTPAQVDNGSSDNCAVDTITLSQTDFTCAEVGDNTVTLTVTDVNGNASTCTATVTVQDNVPPTALCQNVTIQLDATGNASVTPAQVDNGSSDNCAVDTITLSQTDFTCAEVGDNTVTLTVTDVNGNASTCTATVTVQDNVPPTALCQNVTIQLDATGNASVTPAQVDNGSSDNCAVDTITLSQTDFTCAEVGDNTVTLTVTDVNGNASTCTATVTVQDNVPPTALCQNVTIQLDATGNASVTPAQVDNGSSDNCAVDTITLSQTDFTCAEVGDNTVTLTVTDVNGNASTCTATVTVQDNVPPTALCQNVTIQLDATGNASVTPAQVDNGSSDNCAVDTITLSQTDFTCAEVGDNTVTLTVTDVNGNASTCTATVTVQDNVPPTALCQNVTIQLDATGNASVTPAQVDNGSSDNCAVDTITLSQTDFTCAEVGDNTVTLTVTDVNGNASTCTATVTVQDNVPPTALCQNVTIQLDATGNASVTPAQVDNGSSDNCAVDTITLSQTDFTCAEVGDNTVTLTVTDVNGNASTCTATVTVQDNVPPTALCQNVTIQLDATGNASVTPAQVDNGSSDNCAVDTITLSQTDFTCAEVGDNTVTLTVTDVNGNASTCTATVTVQDNVPPTALCQNVTIQLDAAGNASVTPAQVDNGSSDNCAVDTITLSQTDFTCAEVGDNTVTLTVTDVNGNASTCTATVTVQDNVPPTASNPDSISVQCVSDIPAPDVSVVLDENDNCSTKVEFVSDSSLNPDACGGNIMRTYSITDPSGNSINVIQTIIVDDNTPPVIDESNKLDIDIECGITDPNALQNWLDNHAGVTATDNCSTVTWTNDYGQNTSVRCKEGKGITVTFTATDACGNFSQTSAVYHIQDNIPPSITTQASDYLAECDGSGNIQELTDWLASNGGATATDDCSAIEWTNNFTTLSDECGNTGMANVTFTATDACGNTTNTVAKFVIKDNTPPTITVPADVTIECTADESSATNGVATGGDACGLVTITESDVVTTACGNTKTIIRTWTATDECGNSTSADQKITVIDTTPPTITVPADVTIECTADESSASNGVATGADTCGTVTITESDVVTTACGNTKTIIRTWTATDECGNSTSADQKITVIDTTPPTITVPADVTIECTAD